MSLLARVPLYNMACGVCGAPSTALEIHSSGRVSTLHLMTRRRDAKVFKATCWAIPGPPEQESCADKPRMEPGRSGPSLPSLPAPATPGPARLTTELDMRRSA